MSWIFTPEVFILYNKIWGPREPGAGDRGPWIFIYLKRWLRYRQLCEFLRTLFLQNACELWAAVYGLEYLVCWLVLLITSSNFQKDTTRMNNWSKFCFSLIFLVFVNNTQNKQSVCRHEQKQNEIFIKGWILYKFT